MLDRPPPVAGVWTSTLAALIGGSAGDEDCCAGEPGESPAPATLLDCGVVAPGADAVLSTVGVTVIGEVEGGGPAEGALGAA